MTLREATQIMYLTNSAEAKMQCALLTPPPGPDKLYRKRIKQLRTFNVWFATLSLIVALIGAYYCYYVHRDNERVRSIANLANFAFDFMMYGTNVYLSQVQRRRIRHRERELARIARHTQEVYHEELARQELNQYTSGGDATRIYTNDEQANTLINTR